MRKLFFVTSILLVISVTAFAQFETGNSLLAKLEKDDVTPADMESAVEIVTYSALATGYISGVYDVFDGHTFSSPKGVTTTQLADIVKKYLKEHPETRHENACDLVRKALQEAFPLKSPALPKMKEQNIVETKKKDKSEKD